MPVVWTGPVLRSCGIVGRELRLDFDAKLLGDDTVMVTGHTANVSACMGVVFETLRDSQKPFLNLAGYWVGC